MLGLIFDDLTKMRERVSKIHHPYRHPIGWQSNCEGCLQYRTAAFEFLQHLDQAIMSYQLRHEPEKHFENRDDCPHQKLRCADCGWPIGNAKPEEVKA